MLVEAAGSADTTVFPKEYVDWMFGGWETGQVVKPITTEDPTKQYATRTVPDWGVDVVQGTGNHQASYDPDIELGPEDYERKKRMGIYGGF